MDRSNASALPVVQARHARNVGNTTSVCPGNVTTVTDPAGKWKTQIADSEGRLGSVVEPDPASTNGGTLLTSYSYDWMGNLTGVSGARATGTQTRTFVYSDAGLLVSATNPETGTVTYTYSPDNTLHSKHDAKGQDTIYTYDTKKRVATVTAGSQVATYSYEGPSGPDL